jgi:signal transduction histidine kinase
MLTWSALFGAASVAAVGTLILWSNPKRWVNKIVFSCSLHIAVWLISLHLALSVREHGLLWLRWTTAISALIPLHLWLVKEAIALDIRYLFEISPRKILAWLSVSLTLSIVCFTDHFIPASSSATERARGWGFYFYIVAVFLMYCILLVDSFRTANRLAGGRRLALQVWLWGGCASAATILSLMVANTISHDHRLIRFQPLVILIYYTCTAFAITTHRIFDARQLLLVALQKISLVTIVLGAGYLIDQALGYVFSEPFGFLATLAVALWFAGAVNGWLNKVFEFYPQATAARQAALAAGRRESRLENLEAALLGILKGWGQTEHAILLSGNKDGIRGGGIEIEGEALVVRALRQLRWVTPERLAREKETAERAALGAFLEKHSLGVLVIGEGPALTAFIGVGPPASRRPFTFPQVTQLMELGSIMSSSLERAHSSVKAQHAEQLATVGLLGASLAHEIRNPLVSIKTFVQLLPTHHQDPAFREKFFTLIGEEVSRIDRLTEQLLDLASPRAYIAEIVELHPILRDSLDLVVAKATDKRIQFLTEFQAATDQVLTDSSAAKQVLLNLCFNAIQAVESRSNGERWVKVSTRNVHLGVEMVVEDSGPGIAPEIRSKLFQPFHSTKSTGFGLGLAICSDILSGLNATISVDSSAPGRGAAFRVTFPCPVLSSS